MDNIIGSMMDSSIKILSLFLVLGVMVMVMIGALNNCLKASQNFEVKKSVLLKIILNMLSFGFCYYIGTVLIFSIPLNNIAILKDALKKIGENAIIFFAYISVFNITVYHLFRDIEMINSNENYELKKFGNNIMSPILIIFLSFIIFYKSNDIIDGVEYIIDYTINLIPMAYHEFPRLPKVGVMAIKISLGLLLMLKVQVIVDKIIEISSFDNGHIKRKIYKAVKNDKKITVKNKMTKKEIDGIRDYCCSRYIEESYIHDIKTSTADTKLFTVLWNENVILSNLIN